MSLDSLLSNNWIINIICGLVTAVLLWIAAIISPRVKSFFHKYLFFPFWAPKHISNLGQRIGAMEKEIGELRILFAERNNPIVEVSGAMNGTQNKHPAEEFKLHRGLLFRVGPMEDVGPYCQYCYEESSHRILTPLKVGHYSQASFVEGFDSSQDQKSQVHCPKQEHYQYSQEFTESELDNMRRKYAVFHPLACYAARCAHRVGPS